MDCKTHQRVEEWVKEVDRALKAPTSMINKRAITFKNSEVVRRRGPTSGNDGVLLHGVKKADSEVESADVPKLSGRTILCYTAPAFSLTSITMLIGIHGAVFYIGIGAHLEFYAFFIAVARSFDVVTDPIMGWASDVTDPDPQRRVHSKYSFVRLLSCAPRGRRRPYMAVFALGYCIFIVLLLSPPASLETDWQISLWFGVFYTLFYAMDTAANVPYGALGPELSDDSKERDKLFYYSGGFRNIGIMFGATLPVLLALWYDNKHSTDDVTMTLTSEPAGGICPRGTPKMPFQHERCWDAASLCNCLDGIESTAAVSLDSKRAAMTAIAVLFAIEYLVSMIACVWKVREREHTIPEHEMPVVPALLSTFRNKPFMHMLPAWILDMTAITMIGTMLPFFVEYVVKPWAVPECDQRCCDQHSNSFVYSGCRSDIFCKSESWLGIALVALFFTAILAMPLWLAAVKRYGKRSTWLTFNLVTAVTNGVFIFVGAGDPIFMCVLAAANGIPVGAQFLTESIVADVIDYDELLTGRRTEGKFTIFSTFIPKIVSIPAQTIPIALLSAFGFITPCEDGPYHPQPDSVRWYMEALFYGLPTLCTIASYYIKRGFPLTDDKMVLIREGCALHMQGRPARDPVTGKIHRRPSYAGNTKLLKNAVWKLENFNAEQLEWLCKDLASSSESAGRQKLVSEMKKLMNYWIAAAILSVAITVFSLVSDLIHSQTTAWIPTFSVIVLSMSVMFTIINNHRAKTAEQLLEVPAIWSDCKLVLKEVLIHRKGVSSKWAHDHGWFNQNYETELIRRPLQDDNDVNNNNPIAPNDSVSVARPRTPPFKTEFGRYQPETTSYVPAFEDNVFSYPADDVIPPLSYDSPHRGRGSRPRISTQLRRESPFESFTRMNRSPNVYDRQASMTSSKIVQREPPSRHSRSRSKLQETFDVLH
eukprot:TRINITY_DN343_c0_g3_i1.p1 TRINITY_DN343_c0_g3~~TRINITY_DN343_c0_g3_i1.p1  ORF type:complete len:933 (+),score=111.48 TRINITY_DN343_c0_g3_i1:117-2915(+)